MLSKKYFISGTYFTRQEITQDEFVKAERAHGFYPKYGLGPEATGGFSCGLIWYSIEYNDMEEKDETQAPNRS